MVPAGWLPRRRRSSTARRVGSASAWKVASEGYVTERFRIMRNLTVTRRRCQGKSAEKNAGALKIKCKDKINVKGAAQECPTHMNCLDPGMSGGRGCSRRVRRGRLRPWRFHAGQHPG